LNWRFTQPICSWLLQMYCKVLFGKFNNI
jgi:hypothetical protein